LNHSKWAERVTTAPAEIVNFCFSIGHKAFFTAEVVGSALLLGLPLSPPQDLVVLRDGLKKKKKE
jgi:hypothetical protein